MSRYLLLLLSGTFLVFSGCSVNGLDSVLASTSAKYEQLNKRIGELHHNLYWGYPEDVASYVSPEYQADFLQSGKAMKSKERLVDMDVEHVKINDDNTAEVHVRVRYYPIPQYVVHTREEKEKWAFDRFGGGWMLTGKEILSDSDV